MGRPRVSMYAPVMTDTAKRPRGRPPGVKLHPRFLVRLDDETYGRLRRLAFARGVSHSSIAREAIEHYLNRARA
jgi:hypothetical protein